jgi:ribonuclease G
MIALVEGNRVVEVQLDRPDMASRIGEIRLGRVQRVDKGIAAAFLDMGFERPALLPLGDHDGQLAEGDTVTVQVTRDARDGKGARVTGRPVLAGRLLVFDAFHPGVSLSQRLADRDAAQPIAEVVRGLAGAGEGFIVRAAAIAASSEALAREAASLRRAWAGVIARRAGAKPPASLHRDDAVLALLRDVAGPLDEIVIDSRGGADTLRVRLETALPEFAPLVTFRAARDWVPGLDEIDEQIDAAVDPEVPLAGGGSLVIEPGRTLTVIDVNSGGAAADGSGRRAGERRFLESNLAAAEEIARQLRLRNLGGIVVIDFIDLKAPPARARVIDALKAATSDDPAPCWIGQMSRLGLVEMTRRRRGASLAEALTRICPTCGGAGRVSAAPEAVRGGEG